MPNDLYRWEAQGSLVHHCPECASPLTTPQARSRCLGEHVEWCKNYHTQLFKKGTSQGCDPCRRMEEQHHKRHREIAELVHEIKKIQNDEPSTPTPLTPKSMNSVQNPATPDSGTPTKKGKKKDRKLLKKAQKIAGMAKVVTSADVEFVAGVLHPPETPSEDGEEAADFETEDADIKENMAFHKGTSNLREARYELIVSQRESKGKFEVKSERIDAILVELGVGGGATEATSQEKKLLADLRKAIEDDLTHVEKEREGYVMRRGGFWRWASKKAWLRYMGGSA